MEYLPSGTVKDYNSLGILGYLIISNEQVHSYQMIALKGFLGGSGLSLEETCLVSILNGSDNSLSYASSISCFEQESEETKKDFVYMMYYLAASDGYIDDRETEVIADVSNHSGLSKECLRELKDKATSDSQVIRTDNNLIFHRNTSLKKKSVLIRIKEIVLRLLSYIFPSLKKNNAKNDDSEYKTVIDRCSTIAKEDMGIASPCYIDALTEANKTLQSINTYKSTLSLEKGLSANVAGVVGVYSDLLNKSVVDFINKSEKAFSQKKRTVLDFTVSLIGRTKAGKSTLYSILTNEDNSAIGVGKQRTTRYNWVYQWNLLRIIDTPGIGSAEDDGRKDEEIAESVLGESDIICFVVVDDSIQKDVLDFIERISKLNKPILVLLNHKENIIQKERLDRFIKAPDRWLTDDGEANLKGYVDRIMLYARENGFDKMIHVYPVFLLAAQMSGKSEYLQYSDVLWDNSKVGEFIDDLRRMIIKTGSIKRSQTILDESAQTFEIAKKSLWDAGIVLTEQIDALKNQRTEKTEYLKKQKMLCLSNIREILKNKFDLLANNYSLEFAEQVYGRKCDAKAEWETFIEKKGFEGELNELINKELNVYIEKADRVLRELFEDIYYSARVSVDLNDIDIDVDIDLKTILKFTSSAIGIVGTILIAVLESSNPVGWVVAGIGIAVGLIGELFFDSKTKKKQKGINKIYEQIRDSIKKTEPEQVKKVVLDVESRLDDNISLIDNAFLNLSDGLDRVMQMSNNLSAVFDNQIKKVNTAYATRIIQFIDEKHSCTDSDYSDEVINVDRTEDKVIKIYTKREHLFSPEDLEGVVVDRIEIEKGA